MVEITQRTVQVTWPVSWLEIEIREVVALAPLVALMLITGLYPNWVLDVINKGVLTWFPGI